MSPYHYLNLLSIPALVWAGYLAGGYWNYLTPLVCFIIFPLAEIFFNRKLHDDEVLVQPKNETIFFRIIPLLFTVLIVASVIFATYEAQSLKTYEWIGLMLSVGILNGAIGFTLAHEFIHRFTFVERTAGNILLCCGNYLHYSIEHVYGHHVYACTPKDPHTARQGESFYKFFPRAIAGTWLNAWAIEKQRIIKRKKNILFNNRMIFFLFTHIIICSLILLLWGNLALWFFLGQSFIAIVLLHQVNYLQHYGLLRKHAEGKPEKLAAHHSWNTPNPMSKFSLFQLASHADHHMHPTHTYEKLTVHPNSPAHPANYASMIVLSLIPPLWFTIMHKRIPVHH